jgi:hypothetical protein
MNLFKKIFYTGVVLFSILLSTTVFAEVKATNVSEPVRLATVNITDAVITSQKENLFNIHFKISNIEGVQTGVKYGIQLISSVGGKKNVVDDISYSDALTFYTGTIIEKDITYTAPNVTSGEYELILTSMNSEGFPFAFKSLGQVSISSISDVSIIADSCFLSVLGEKGNPIYTLDNVVDIDKSENLSITCAVSNSSKKYIKISPVFETYEGITSYGSLVEVENLKTELISLKSQETKNVTLNLPKAKNSGTYNIKFNFKYDDKTTNSVNPKYLIRGKNISITNVFLDKDSYLKNEIANISVLWVPPVNKLVRTINNDSYDVVLEAIIKDGNNKNCGEQINKKINSGLEKFSVLIQKNCSNPTALVTLKDNAGNILDQKGVIVKTNSKNQMPNIFYIIIIIALLVIVGLYLYMKNKKGTGLKMIMFAFFFAGLSFAGSASADTFTSLCGHNTAGNGNDIYCNYTIDVPSTILAGSSITSHFNQGITAGYAQGPSSVKWNGQNGILNTCTSLPCLASYIPTTNPSVSVVASPINGDYNLNILATWNFAGIYTSNIDIPYTVYGGTSGGGGGGGGSTNGGLNVYANPGTINEGQSSVVSWNVYGGVTLANNGNDCTVFKGNSMNGNPMYTGPSSYQTEDLYETTTYEVRCGILAIGPNSKKFAFLPDSINKLINNILPYTAFADVVNTISGTVTVNVAQNTGPIVSLSLNSNNEKDLVRYGSTDLIGTTHLYVYISDLPASKYCYLKDTTNNSLINTYGPGPINNYSDYLDINNLQDNEIVFELMCNDQNSTSDSQTVKAQSGTLSSPTVSACTNPSGGLNCCTIPSGSSACSLPQTISWTTVNNYYGYNSYVTKDGAGNVGSPANNSSNTPITVAFGSNTYRLFNKVDGENNGPAVPNEIKSIEIVGQCLLPSTWDGTKCNPPGEIDLIAYPVSPNSATVGQVTEFSSIVKNQGTKTTGVSFYNKFQTTTGFDNNSQPINPTNYDVGSVSALESNSQVTIKKSITFNTAGAYYIRACADESTITANNNKITESSEINNCSDWRGVTVSLAAAPDLVSSTTTPTSATLGTPKVFTSIITNQGNLSTGTKFYNLFQVATLGSGSSGGAGGSTTMNTNKWIRAIAGIFGKAKVAEAVVYNVIGNYSTILQMNTLASGASATANSPAISFPATGIYYIRACADKNSAGSSGVITESNEANNCGDWVAVNVTSLTLPDLTASSITPTVAVEKIPVTFSATITNLGTSSTGIGFKGLVQRASDIEGRSAVNYFEVSMTPLSGGLSKAYSLGSKSLDAGTYYVRICADKGMTSPGVIAESNENNNCGAWTKIIVSPNSSYADLVSSNPYVYTTKDGIGFNNKYINKAEAGSGEIIKTFAFVVSNPGTAPTGVAFPNLFQIATQVDGSDAIDQLPATMAPAPIAPNGGSYIVVSNPITFTDGVVYYMRSCADKANRNDGGVITELDETNNCSSWGFVNLSNNPIDGGWSEWSCGECSVPCGSGTKTCNRTCTNPAPDNGGKNCDGLSYGEQVCNTQACPTECLNGAVDYPTCTQCSDGTLPSSYPGNMCPECSNGAVDYPTCKECSDGTSPSSYPGNVCPEGNGGGGGVFNLSFSASPALIFKGRPSTLTWTSTGATSCSSSQFATGGQVNGNAKVNPTSTTTYTITCTGTAGSDSASAVVRVISPTIIEN